MPLISRIIKVLQSSGVEEIFILSNILALKEERMIKIIRTKEEVEAHLGPDYLLIDVPAVFDVVFMKSLLQFGVTGILSLSKVKERKLPGVYVPLTKEEDFKLAVKKLFQSLRKPHDTLISRTMNRPVSLFVSRFLVKTPLKPNLITFFVFLVGVAAAWVLVMYPNYWGGLIGGTLFHLCSVLDGCDGEVARLKFQTSRAGVWLDAISDETTNFLFLGALGVYCATYYENALFFNLAMIGMAVFFVTKIIQYTMIALGYTKEDISQYDFAFEQKGEQKGLKKVFTFLFNIGKNVARNDFYALGMMAGGILGILNVGLMVALGMTGALFISVLIDFLKKVVFAKKLA